MDFVVAENLTELVRKMNALTDEALAEQQFVNKTRVMALQRAAAEYQMKQGENAAELSRAKRSATDLELRMSSLRDAYVQEATTELRDVNGKLIDLASIRQAEVIVRQMQMIAERTKG